MSRIIIIEDNEQNARLAAKLLKVAGYEVLLAEDGETGLSMVHEHQPDLALVDLGLPDMDGQTVVALLRQYPHLSHMPIIAFTAWPEETAHQMVQAYGCDGVITKPVQITEFAGQIKAFLEAARA